MDLEEIRNYSLLVRQQISLANLNPSLKPCSSSDIWFHRLFQKSTKNSSVKSRHELVGQLPSTVLVGLTGKLSTNTGCFLLVASCSHCWQWPAWDTTAIIPTRFYIPKSLKGLSFLVFFSMWGCIFHQCDENVPRCDRPNQCILIGSILGTFIAVVLKQI